MNFISDNIVGASAKILAAITAANDGTAGSYGADPWTAKVEAQLNAFFEREVTVFMVATGTAANALAAAAICPPWGTLLTHRESHVIDDECGAPEFYMGGAKIAGLPGIGGKITPEALDAHFANEPGGTRRPPIKGLSMAQGTEFGLVYSVPEITDLTAKAREHGLKVHMDGARFSNALVALGCTPAEMTWKAGIDVLSLGGTKNGCLMAEAVIFFDPALAEGFSLQAQARRADALEAAADFGAVRGVFRGQSLARSGHACQRDGRPPCQGSCRRTRRSPRLAAGNQSGFSHRLAGTLGSPRCRRREMHRLDGIVIAARQSGSSR